MHRNFFTTEKKMKLNIKEVLWCFLFKIKPIRLLIFYNNKRYNDKLNLLNNLSLNKNSIWILERIML